MFYCEKGKHLTGPGQRCVKVVAERREKSYSEPQRDAVTKKIVSHKSFSGWEIAREERCCDAHAAA